MFSFEKVNEKELEEYIAVKNDNETTSRKLWESFQQSPDYGFVPFMIWVEIEQSKNIIV